MLITNYCNLFHDKALIFCESARAWKSVCVYLLQESAENIRLWITFRRKKNPVSNFFSNTNFQNTITNWQCRFNGSGFHVKMSSLFRQSSDCKIISVLPYDFLILFSLNHKSIGRSEPFQSFKAHGTLSLCWWILHCFNYVVWGNWISQEKYMKYFIWDWPNRRVFLVLFFLFHQIEESFFAQH